MAVPLQTPSSAGGYWLLILWYYAVANPMADLNIVPIANLRRDLASALRQTAASCHRRFCTVLP